MSESIIHVSGLTRRFGANTALDSVCLSLPRGAVYGLVGANGAGKTTLIKHILGLFRAESGSVRVFGLDPVVDPVGVLSRIGYLSEEHDLPGWMRVDELIRYSRAFYPAWDDAYAEELRQAFELETTAHIKHLSKGQRARAGLLVALAHRPELLVLDEPSSGLDPVVRRDILGAIVRTIAGEGRTVLFSSHLLDEVERVADHITMINQGRIVLSASLDAIRQSHRIVTIQFAEALPRPPTHATVQHVRVAAGQDPKRPAHATVLRWHGEGQEWTAVCHGGSGELQASVAEWDARIVSERVPSLDEIFVAYVGTPAPSPPDE